MHQHFDQRTQAKNIVNYLRIIHRILAPGGVWINLGDNCCVLEVGILY